MNLKSQTLRAEYVEKCADSINRYIQVRGQVSEDEYAVLRAESWALMVLSDLWIRIDNALKEKQRG